MIVHGKKRRVDNCPNRLFLSYLKIWRDEAEKKESKSYHTYNRAYKSLEKYPLPLQSGKEAIILENFGSKICAMLDRKLETEASEKGMTCCEYLKQSRSVPESWWDTLEEQAQRKQQRKHKKIKSSKSCSRIYIPQKNSGAYAILLTLHRCYASNSWLNKADLQTLAQPLAAKSFTVPDHGSHYTAWSSMATLLSKNLVKKFGNPAKYEITDEGNQLAARIEFGEKTSSDSSLDVCEKENIRKAESTSAWSLSDSDLEQNDAALHHWNVESDTKFGESALNTLVQANSGKQNRCLKDKVDLTLTSSDSDLDCSISAPNQPSLCKTMLKPSIHTMSLLPGQVCLYPGSFRVILCVDSRELSGDKRRYELRRLLENNRIEYIERVLQIGDFVWAAQEKLSQGYRGQPKELVLDYVVERKCMSDLAQSIRDKRFREQKIRLKQCGIKRVIYLAEELSRIDHQSLPGQTLRQALINTMIVDQIHVKFSENLAETAQYLKVMTSKLSNMYENVTLRSSSLAHDKGRDILSHSAVSCDLLTFNDFNDDSVKTKGLTANELFIKQLMQIHGMSFHKAHAIAQVYPTPLALYKAYQYAATFKEKETLLSKIKFGISQRNVGIVTSRNVYHVFNTD